MSGANEERRSPVLIESRAPWPPTTRVCLSPADSAMPARALPDEKPEKPEAAQHGPNTDATDGAKSSSSAESSSSRVVASPDSAVVVESTIGSTSLCDSQDATSVTSLRATSGGRGRQMSVPEAAAYAARRRRAIRTFWRMHRNAMLIVFFVLFIVGCLMATAVDRRRTALADLAAAAMAPSEKDARHVKDALAVPTVPFSKWKSVMMGPAARAISTTPSAHGGDGDDGELSPVPTSVETEARGDTSDALDNVEAHDEETPWTAAGRLESTRTTKWQRTRLPAVSTSRRLPLRELSPRQSRDPDEGDTGPGNRMHAPSLPNDALHDPFGSLTNDRCGAVRYTFCPRLRREVFYDRESRDCVAVVTAAEHEAEKEVASRVAARYQHTSADKDEAPLCNSSPNRFSSLESCRQSCQRNELPAERCFDKTLFTDCGREHVLSTRWYFDGRRCREWHFPAGRCPTAQAFRSRAQCARTCAASAVGPEKKSPQNDRCGPAPSRPCNERQLRFLYFADVASSDGQVRCLKASQATLVGRRCLVGPNRFEDLAKCRAACVRGGDEGADRH